MIFAKRIFQVAAVWGFLILTPLYFIVDQIGKMDPPPVTHPVFFYGFVGIALAWQVAFLIIAKDPVRYRLLMIPSMLEKVGYGGAVVTFFLQGKLNPNDLVFGLADLLLAALFLAAFYKTPRSY